MSFQTESKTNSSLELSTLPPFASTYVEEQEVYVDEERFPQDVAIGERQHVEFRDAGFAVAFLTQLVIVLVLTFYWGFPALTPSSSTASSSSSTKPDKSYDDPVAFVGWLYVLLLSGVVAMAMSALGLYIMARYAKQLIQISALFHLMVSLVLIIEFLAEQVYAGAAAMLLVVVLGAWYFWSVQNRIHFAASNLVTASQAIRSNLGIMLVALVMALVSFIWSALWVVAFNGARLKTSHCEEYDSSGKECISTHYNIPLMALLLLSFYWTHQVILNIVHVTVAGVVATFWFAPEEATSFCSPSIWDSWRRASTSSLGSIALGSLLLAILQWVQHAAHYVRRHRGNGFLSCLAECCASVLEQLGEYFNKWAFVFVSVYGYSYFESGRKAMELFRQKGWTDIIYDQLTYNALNMMVVAVGFSAAGIMLGVATVVGGLTNSPQSAWVVAGIALTIGVVMASVAMRVVASAVDTVIVCFAEAPNDFQRHHPELHQNMIEAWRLTYPTEFGYVASAVC